MLTFLGSRKVLGIDEEIEGPGRTGARSSLGELTKANDEIRGKLRPFLSF